MTKLKYELNRPAGSDTPAKRLAILRREHGFRQGDVADRLGITRSTYVGYENLDRTPPWQLLCAIADLYGVSLDYILCHTDDRGRAESKPVLAADQDGKISALWFQGSETDRRELTEYLQSCYQMFVTAHSTWKRQENTGHLMQLIRNLSSLRPGLKAELESLGDDVRTTQAPFWDTFVTVREQINADLDEIYRDTVKDAIISAL